MRLYLAHWKRIFDYKGASTRAEYRLPLIVAALLAALTAACWAAGSFADAPGLMTAGFVAGVVFALHVPPMMALTVRRLRDAGKHPLLSLIACIAGVGTVIVMIVCLCSVSSTGYLPLHNIGQSVYGPPEYFDPHNNINEDIYGPPEMFGDYDPQDNVTAAVYGPPEMLFGEEDAAETLPPEEGAAGDEN